MCSNQILRGKFEGKKSNEWKQEIETEQKQARMLHF